jgi:hypothetical protein
MKLGSVETLVRALDEASVRYLVAGRPQDRIDIEYLRELANAPK